MGVKLGVLGRLNSLSTELFAKSWFIVGTTWDPTDGVLCEAGMSQVTLHNTTPTVTIGSCRQVPEVTMQVHHSLKKYQKLIVIDIKCVIFDILFQFIYIR